MKQADGRYKLENYIAGNPFPNPSGPDKGTEIAANVTYRLQGYLVAVSVEAGNAGSFNTKDRFGNYNTEVVDASIGSSRTTGNQTRACRGLIRRRTAPGTRSI